MAQWTAFPYDASGFAFDAARVRADWAQLHVGAAEPVPEAPAALEAWALFHAGRFAEAVVAGRAEAAGRSGAVAADRAQLAHAHYLEPHEGARARLFHEVAERAAARTRAAPGDAGAHHVLAIALVRQAQTENIGRALSKGLLTRVRVALEATIALAPQHARAHATLGAFHAEVIDKLGSLIGRTQGVSKDRGLGLLRAALKLDPASVYARVEYANGLMTLEGEPGLEQATRLYQEAAALPPRDALERLEVEMARQALQE